MTWRGMRASTYNNIINNMWIADGGRQQPFCPFFCYNMYVHTIIYIYISYTRDRRQIIRVPIDVV